MEFCSQMDINPWSSTYKIMTIRFKCHSGLQIMSPTLLLKIIHGLLPKTSESVPAVTRDERLEIYGRIGDSKAAPTLGPGPHTKSGTQAYPEIQTRYVGGVCFDVRGNFFLHHGSAGRQYCCQRLEKKQTIPLQIYVSLETIGKMSERVIQSQ